MRRLAPANFTRALIAAAKPAAASKRLFDVIFEELALPPTDQARARQLESLRQATGAAQISQSAERWAKSNGAGGHGKTCGNRIRETRAHARHHFGRRAPMLRRRPSERG